MTTALFVVIESYAGGRRDGVSYYGPGTAREAQAKVERLRSAAFGGYPPGTSRREVGIVELRPF